VHPARRAYTLLEMMLLLVIIVMLAALAYPSLDSMYGDFKVSSAADQVRAAWAEGRAQAINEGRAYRFAVIPGKGNYRLAPDSNEFWGGNGATSANPTSTDQPVILEKALPKGVRLVVADPSGASPDLTPTDDTVAPAGSVDPSQYQSVVTFLPDGTSREDVQMVFSSRGVRPLVLSLRGITGAVSVRPLEQNGQLTAGNKQ
jgi:type II secretory pathway pseudopilin PulG